MQIEIPPYSSTAGVKLIWESSEIALKVTAENEDCHIVANRAGLISLARFLLTLAQDDVPSGTHVHLDDLNGMDPDSHGLVIERSEERTVLGLTETKWL